jgi:hypothetical protein
MTGEIGRDGKENVPVLGKSGAEPSLRPADGRIPNRAAQARWPNPQSRSAGCDGLTIWSNQSKARSNPHPKKKHTNHSRNQWNGSPESSKPLRPPPLPPTDRGAHEMGRFLQSAPPMGATAPTDCFPPSPNLQRSTSDQITSPSIQSRTPAAPQELQRKSRDGEAGRARRSGSPRPNWRGDRFVGVLPVPAPQTRQRPPYFLLRGSRRAEREREREREREPREEGLVGLQCAARKREEWQAKTEGERKGKAAGGS